MKKYMDNWLPAVRCAGSFLAGLWLCTAVALGGDERPGLQAEGAARGDEIRELKIAYFSDALQLTPEQSERFWPVYNEYWRARREVGKRRFEAFRAIREGREPQRQFDTVMEVMEKERKLMVDYLARFRQILPQDKAVRVFVADEDFKNFLIRKMTGRGPGGHNNNGGR